MKKQTLTITAGVIGLTTIFAGGYLVLNNHVLNSHVGEEILPLAQPVAENISYIQDNVHSTNFRGHQVLINPLQLPRESEWAMERFNSINYSYEEAVLKVLENIYEHSIELPEYILVDVNFWAGTDSLFRGEISVPGSESFLFNFQINADNGNIYWINELVEPNLLLPIDFESSDFISKDEALRIALTKFEDENGYYEGVEVFLALALERTHERVFSGDSTVQTVQPITTPAEWRISFSKNGHDRGLLGINAVSGEISHQFFIPAPLDSYISREEAIALAKVHFYDNHNINLEGMHFEGSMSMNVWHFWVSGTQEDTFNWDNLVVGFNLDAETGRIFSIGAPDLEFALKHGINTKIETTVYNGMDVTIIERSPLNYDPQAHHLNAVEASEIAAVAIYDEFGISIDGKILYMFFHDSSLGGSVEGWTINVNTTESLNIGHNNDYNMFLVMVDAITGEVLSLFMNTEETPFLG